MSSRADVPGPLQPPLRSTPETTAPRSRRALMVLMATILVLAGALGTTLVARSGPPPKNAPSLHLVQVDQRVLQASAVRQLQHWGITGSTASCPGPAYAIGGSTRLCKVTLGQQVGAMVATVAQLSSAPATFSPAAGVYVVDSMRLAAEHYWSQRSHGVARVSACSRSGAFVETPFDHELMTCSLVVNNQTAPDGPLHFETAPVSSATSGYIWITSTQAALLDQRRAATAALTTALAGTAENSLRPANASTSATELLDIGAAHASPSLVNQGIPLAWALRHPHWSVVAGKRTSPGISFAAGQLTSQQFYLAFVVRDAANHCVGAVLSGASPLQASALSALTAANCEPSAALAAAGLAARSR